MSDATISSAPRTPPTKRNVLHPSPGEEEGNTRRGGDLGEGGRRDREERGGDGEDGRRPSKYSSEKDGVLCE